MRYGTDRGFQFRITPAVKYLILVNVGIFILDTVFQLQLPSLFGLRPALFWRGLIWQPVTYMFLHAGIFHLLINMLILWMFGTSLESVWGTRRLLKFFFICGISAGLLNAIVTPASPIPTVGASGAIYGLLMAFGILFPNQLIYIWGIFPVKAKYFVIGIGVIEFLAAISATQSGVAHVAHLGGMIFGLFYMKWDSWHRSLSSMRSERQRKKHLKIVRERTREKESIQKDVDRLLDKINTSGVESLTSEEREWLEKMSRVMKDLDNKTV